MALSPTLILDNHLYLSDVNFAQDEVSVEKHKIDIIVNASSEKYAIPEGVKYVQFELVDEDRAPIESYFGTRYFSLYISFFPWSPLVGWAPRVLVKVRQY